MSAALAAFTLLALALAGGLVAYERTRPPARVLALVGTLAALAALGRIAFAPLPNVKPTTDIVLVAGTALGSAAGFAVGAVAALVSNLFFGQGPWTPWQMLGWGLTGLIGAGLGVLWRRAGRGLPGRIPLALAGVLAAAVFGACVDLGTAATAGSAGLWPRFLGMYLGTSLAWNAAHAAGNVAFALAFGPALLRAVARFRTRFTVRWGPAHPAAPAASTLGALLLVGLLLLPASAHAATPSGYLARAQRADGGWGSSPRARSSSLYTAWAALARAAGGVNPLDQVSGGGRTPVDLLRGSVGRLEDVGEVERTMLVLGAAGVSPRSFGGRDLRAALLRHRRPEGSFDRQIAFTAFAVLALRATGTPASAGVVRGAAGFLARQQERGGGWNFYRRGGLADVDDTGAALQALRAAGRGRSAAARRGAAWLVRQQRGDGGFAGPGGASNSQSTAFAVQGLLAAGRNPDRVRRRGRSPLDYLRARTRRDGSVAYSASSRQTPVWVTAQAQLALRRRPLPLRRVPRRATAGRAAAPAPSPAAPEPADGTSPAAPSAAAATRPAPVPGRPENRPGAAAAAPAPLGPAAALVVRSIGAIAGVAFAPFATTGR